nr:MAG TPA: hypothetical protein [Caudoviricetes sp.]
MFIECFLYLVRTIRFEVSLKRYFLWFDILILFNIATLVCPFYSF